MTARHASLRDAPRFVPNRLLNEIGSLLAGRLLQGHLAGALPDDRTDQVGRLPAVLVVGDGTSTLDAGGRIVDQGSYDDLLERSELFRSLAR